LMCAHTSITLFDTNLALLGDVIQTAVAVGQYQSLIEAHKKRVVIAVKTVPLPENDPMPEIA
jgi:hypothetical protein